MDNTPNTRTLAAGTPFCKIVNAYLAKFLQDNRLLQLSPIGSVGGEPDVAKGLFCALPVVWPQMDGCKINGSDSMLREEVLSGVASPATGVPSCSLTTAPVVEAIHPCKAKADANVLEMMHL